jgi:predicted dehydrogenase
MDINRRSFTQASVAAGALAASGQLLGANDRIRLGLIGSGRRGRVVASAAAKAGAGIATLCDLDERVIRSCGVEIAKVQKTAPATVKDFRRVLDDKNIDGVIIATPDHWHARLAILACQAGKDVFVEKPLSQTIFEGQQMREAARKYKRIVQVGTQRRSTEHFRSAIDYVASGKLGKVCQIKAWIYEMRPSIGKPPDSDPPAGVDYDAWLGPAPKRPFNPNRFHYNWRFFWDYGNTELGNQGVHVLDVALWGIQKLRGMENCMPKRITTTGGIYWLDDAKEVPDTQVVAYEYDNLMLTFELRAFARDHIFHQGKLAPGDPGSAEFFTAFYGTEGTLLVDMSGWKVYTKDRGIGPEAAPSGGSHEKDFLDCMRSRALPNSDVEIGRLSTTLCHLGNIAYRVGHPVKFDAKTESFPGDAQANALLTKAYRKPYELPKV